MRLRSSGLKQPNRCCTEYSEVPADFKCSSSLLNHKFLEYITSSVEISSSKESIEFCSNDRFQVCTPSSAKMGVPILPSFLELGTLATIRLPTDRATLITTLLLLLFVAKLFLHPRRTLPPGPFAWPIVGNLFSLGSLPYKTLRSFARQHGDLTYLRMGSTPCIVVNSAVMAKEVITHHDLQFANRPSKLFSKTLLNSKDIIAQSYGPAWRHLRMICTSQFFTKKRLASYESGRTQEIHILIKLIREQAGSTGMPINLPFQLRNTATNIISRMVFNKRLFVEGGEGHLEDAQRYQKILNIHFASYAVFVISDYIPSLGFVTTWQGTREKMKKIAEQIHQKMDEIIDLEGREARRTGRSVEEEARSEKDFVDLLLETPAHDGQGTLDHETVRAVVLDMLFAGAETQSTTLEWAMALLIRHPEVMARAQSELDNVIGPDRVVSESDLEHLPYLEAVMKEVLRLQPGAPMAVNHESREETCVAGYTFPAYTRLIFNIHAIHRDPTVYDRPEEFHPERFLRKGQGQGQQQQQEGLFQLMPFGAGRRICPGMSLANITMCHMLAHLLHSFDWRLPGEANPRELDMEERFDGITAPRLHSLLAVAHPRKPAFLY